MDGWIGHGVGTTTFGFQSLKEKIYPGGFIPNSFYLCRTPSIQTSIHSNFHTDHEHFERFCLFVILLKCVTASEDVVRAGFEEAVDGENFGWLRINWESWKDRKDLLDYVIAKGADVTVGLIQNVESAKGYVLAALFDKGEGMIDECA